MARTKAAPVPVTPARLREVLGAYRYGQANERDLQDGIAQALALRGIRFDRTVQLAPGIVADFLIEGIAVAVVLERDAAEVLTGLARSSRAKALLLVVPRGRAAPPAKVGGKPVHVVGVG